MLRDGRAALLCVAASLALHGGFGLLLWGLPADLGARSSGPVRFEVLAEAPGPGGDPSGVPGARASRSTELRPGGADSAQNVDTARRGDGGDAEGPSAVILMLDHADAVTLQDAPMNAPRVWQTQRIRTARDRASWEDRRATPNPRDTPFLASGDGPHPERRPLAATDAQRGARVAPEASARGAERTEREPSADRPGAHSSHSGQPEGSLPVGSRAEPSHRTGGAEQPHNAGGPTDSPGRGIRQGRGRRASEAADVAHGRPPVDRGPAATPARRQGRVRDDVDAEQLAGGMVQSFVEASQRSGRRRDEGRGGVGGGGAPGSGGGHAEGGRAAPHGPGGGRWPALDTRNARYRHWYLEQRRRVERALEFPRARQLAMDQGTSVYRVVVRRDGSLAKGPRLLRSSGFDDLDAAARSAIEGSMPFNPLPADLAPAHPAIEVTLAVQFSNPMVH